MTKRILAVCVGLLITMIIGKYIVIDHNLARVADDSKDNILAFLILGIYPGYLYIIALALILWAISLPIVEICNFCFGTSFSLWGDDKEEDNLDD